MSIIFPGVEAINGDIVESITKTYFGHNVTAYTTNSSLKYYSGFPWCFKIESPDGETRRYTGIPNHVETRAAALKRGWYRAKWLADGTYNERYNGAE